MVSCNKDFCPFFPRLESKSSLHRCWCKLFAISVLWEKRNAFVFLLDSFHRRYWLRFNSISIGCLYGYLKIWFESKNFVKMPYRKSKWHLGDDKGKFCQGFSTQPLFYISNQQVNVSTYENCVEIIMLLVHVERNRWQFLWERGIYFWFLMSKVSN